VRIISQAPSKRRAADADAHRHACTAGL